MGRPSPVFTRLQTASDETAVVFTRWESDPELVPLTRRNRDAAELAAREVVTVAGLEARLEHHAIYLIHVEGRLVGEMSYRVDPEHLFHGEPGTAWVGITLGEPAARGRGIGTLAMGFLEEEIRKAGLHRIELGVFAFNEPAIRTYRKLGYQDMGRIRAFTFWQGRMWDDLRMEKRFV